MSYRRITKNKELAFVLPLIFAVGFLVLALMPTAFAFLFVDIAIIIVALDVYAIGIYGLLWLLSDESKPS